MNVVLKVVGAIIVILALVIAIVPQFTNCQYNKSMAAPTTATTMAGATTTMAGGQATTPTTVKAAATTAKPRCFYTARAEIAVGVTLFFIGAFMLMGGRRETWRALSVLGIIQGVFAILLPTVLIGDLHEEHHDLSTGDGAHVVRRRWRRHRLEPRGLHRQ